MELWQMDIMGGVKLEDGSELKIVTGLDDHSRFCVSALLVPRATARPVCEALALAMRRHGVPDQILTDNGKVFTSRFGPGKGEVLFDRICRENGIRHLLTAPRSPTTTGKVERFHKTVRREFLAGRVFASLEEAQAELDAWVACYNTERPHQGIGMVPPEQRFALGRAGHVRSGRPRPRGTGRGIREPGRHDVRRITRSVGEQRDASAWPPSAITWALACRGDGGGRDRRSPGADLPPRGAGGHPCPPASGREASRPPGTQPPRSPKARPETSRACPSSARWIRAGDVSFAGTGYRVGNAYTAQEQVEVRLVGDTVQICSRRHAHPHPRRPHDPSKEHGAFANPGGRPRKKKAS